jgi:hypothetical protein
MRCRSSECCGYCEWLRTAALCLRAKGKLPVVQYLVQQHGADIHAVDMLGHTPLHVASHLRGNSPSRRAILGLQHVADVHAVDGLGHTHRCTRLACVATSTWFNVWWNDVVPM